MKQFRRENRRHHSLNDQINGSKYEREKNLSFIDNRTVTRQHVQLQSQIDNSAKITSSPNFTAKENKTGLPDQIKSGVETLSGYALDDVKVHYNSSKPVQLNAHAFAQGTNIHLARGQEHNLAHEAWHVVQQKQGRVAQTKQMAGIKINDSPALEKEADLMGAKALQLSGNCFTTPSRNSSNLSLNTVAQGYFTTSNFTDNDADFTAQEAYGRGNNKRYLSHHHGLRKLKPPSRSNFNLHVSEDGKMAIEAASDRRQAKMFYAESAVISASNKSLNAVGSRYNLYIEKSNALTVNDQQGQAHSLGQVVPRDLSSPAPGVTNKAKRALGLGGYTNEGVNMTIQPLCNEVASAICGNPRLTDTSPTLARDLGTLTTFAEVKVAQYIYARLGLNAMGVANPANVKTQDEAIDEMTDAIDANLMNDVAKAYSIMLATNPVAAQNIANELGINTQANPEVGEAFGSISLGSTNHGAMSDFGADPTGATTKSASEGEMWGTHYGAVVAKSAGNMVTLENYARHHELRNITNTAKSSSQRDQLYYFAMYGPITKPQQTWHAKWTTANRNIINPITMVFSGTRQDTWPNFLKATAKYTALASASALTLYGLYRLYDDPEAFIEMATTTLEMTTEAAKNLLAWTVELITNTEE